jgi:flagellar biosynthetic protein FlhB
MNNQKQESENEKTFEPSQRKIEKFREEGHFAISREVGSFIILIAIYYLMNNIVKISQKGIIMFSQAYSNLSISTVTEQIKSTLLNLTGQIALLAFFLAFFMGIQTRFAFSTKKLHWNFSKLNVFKGIFQIFSKQIVIECIKTIFKLFALIIAIYMTFKNQLDDLFLVQNIAAESFFTILKKTILPLIKTIILYFGALVGFDYGLKFYQHYKMLRMDKKEQKDEHKDQEGDPQIKQIRKKIQRENLKKLISKVVPKAEFIVTNPDHYAVAIEWQDKTKNPIVSSKGTDLMAEYMKKIARESGVPVIQSPLLARKLYAEVEIGSSIKREHFRAIAEIIIYLKKEAQKNPKKW